MYRRQGMRSMINSRTTTRATFSSSFASSFVYSFAQCDLDVGSAKTLEPNTLLPEFPIRPRVTHLSSLRGNFESRFRFRFIAREHWFRRACKWYSLSKPVLRPTRVRVFFFSVLIHARNRCDLSRYRMQIFAVNRGYRECSETRMITTWTRLSRRNLIIKNHPQVTSFEISLFWRKWNRMGPRLDSFVL